MERQLIKDRDSLLFRGIGITTFGLVALCYPGQQIHALMMPFGILVTISGLVTVAKNIHPLVSRHYREDPLSKKGLMELVIGGAAVGFALFSVAVFWILLATWLMMTGIANVSRYNNIISCHPEVKVILAVNVLSVLLGLFILLNKVMELVPMSYEVAGFALLLGLSSLYTYFKLGKLQQYLGHRPRKINNNQMNVYYDRAY